jgi:glutamate dehydrogenase
MTYGMTTASVHSYVVGLLQELKIDESTLTKFQTGGPDGDLGSNEILVSKDKTVGIVDGSGVLYDPTGLNREELVRLATRRVTVKEYSKSLLTKDGFLVLVDEVNVTLPDGARFANGAQLRDTFHLTKYATADLFVPCGGRPNAVNGENVKHFFGADGKPKFKYIVEGANLFFHASAREVLENAGVHVFKDASTNKGGVTSSSLEVLAALSLPPAEHGSLMCYDPKESSEPPEFYQTYVQEVVAIIMENAKQEFQAIWATNQNTGVHKAEATRLLSIKINQITDSVQDAMTTMPADEKDVLVSYVLTKALPPLIVKHLGIDGLLARVPPNYIAAIVGAWVGSRFVYKNGIEGSEVAFYLFMRSLMDGVEKA